MVSEDAIRGSLPALGRVAQYAVAAGQILSVHDLAVCTLH
jgi:hypothetical protein